jgi:site-specific DNA-methyltransferase (adenine-specific)
MTEWKSDDGRVRLICGDCMDFMRGLPDKAFSLAIVDPPYGIGENGGKCRTRLKHANLVKHARKDWDAFRPEADYFKALRRVSENQIVWGANYFTDHLPPCMGWVFWDKLIGGDFSDGELAFTSFDRALKKVTLWSGNNGVPRIHPTQKPVALYRWLLQNYAKEGDRILDTHGGSMSSVIACHEKGFDVTCCELDADYYAAGLARVQKAMQQQTLDFGGNP